MNYNYKFYIFFIFLLTSCATFQAQKYNINIDLNTMDLDKKPIDAVCTLYSSSTKVDVLAPKKFVFNSECSSINIICKSGEMIGESGLMQKKTDKTAQNFIINSGIGYIFDRAVETITPLGSMLNFMSDDEDCNVNRRINVVLE